jgi:hypothetical protein
MRNLSGRDEGGLPVTSLVSRPEIETSSKSQLELRILRRLSAS